MSKIVIIVLIYHGHKPKDRNMGFLFASKISVSTSYV
jgi:hypothetical protein